MRVVEVELLVLLVLVLLLLLKGSEKVCPLAAAVSEASLAGGEVRRGSSVMLCRRGVVSVMGLMVVAVADLLMEGRVLTVAGFVGPRAPPLALTFLKHSDPHTSLNP